jgi:hypothetical protein
MDEPQQEVEAQVEVPWEQKDWSGLTEREQDRRMADLLEADRRREFEMARAPLLRLTLVRRSDTKNYVLWTFHHALLDGWSFASILWEVFTYYDASRAGTELTLPVPRPYRDYISWLQQRDLSKDEGFWRRTLEGFVKPTPLVERLPSNDCKMEKARSGTLAFGRGYFRASFAGRAESTNFEYDSSGCLVASA